MEGNLMNLVCLVASGPATSGYAHSIDPHFYFTSTQAHDQPALQKVAKAMQRGPDHARKALESACDRGSISEFHELNLLFVAEATEANAILREIEALATRPASKTAESNLRARFDEHCSAAEDYLDQAEQTATSMHDSMVVVENRASLDLLRGDTRKAAEGYVRALSVRQTETLWANLLIALDRLGADEAIDHVLVTIGRAGTPRLLATLDADHDLANVRRRPAYREHVEHQA
jgi:hypothetical protein